MLKTLKNYQIIDLMEAFTKIGEKQIKSNKKFSYAVILNDETLQPKIKALRSIAQPSDSYAEYEQKRNDLLVEYAKVDVAGNIKINDVGMVEFKDGVDGEVDTKFKALNEEYADIIEERNNDITEYNEILDKEVEVEIETLSYDDFPDEVGEDIFLTKMLMAMTD